MSVKQHRFCIVLIKPSNLFFVVFSSPCFADCLLCIHSFTYICQFRPECFTWRYDIMVPRYDFRISVKSCVIYY